MSETIRVLLVDDHRMFVEAIELLLAGEHGIEALGAATTGEEAIEHCRRVCPDVVLMDIDLPGMDGIEATRGIREECPDAQVVVLTALQPAGILAGAIEAGACGFIAKTQAADELVGVIRRAAAGEIVLPAGDAVQTLRRLQEWRRPRSDARELLSYLTRREVEILQAVAGGKTTAEIAGSLAITVHTVESHVRSILMKLGVRSRLQALLLALREGLVTLGSDA